MTSECDMTPYLEMLVEEGIMERSMLPVVTAIPEEETCSGSVSYPSNWAMPRATEMYATCTVTKRRYTPYQRISHFREHLNRLQYCQYVTIPKHVIEHINRCLDYFPIVPSFAYNFVKDQLRLRGWSCYNEHIHHIISQWDKGYIDITYTDRRLMCQVFRQMEQVFLKEPERKNIFSYYLLVQFFLLLFHYHPRYWLPSIKDVKKKLMYYQSIFNMFSKTPMYNDIIFIFKNRAPHCKACKANTYMFDVELVSLLIKLL